MSHVGNGGSPVRPVALFVLGVPRSGTSAVTRVLSLCGATLPAGLSGADPRNPRGYWEPRAALHLNNTILRRYGSAVFDPSLRLQEDGGLDADQKAACISKIGEFLATLPDAPLVLIKDLQITLLSGVWFEAARQAGFDVAVVNMVRPPQEVIASGAADFLTLPELGSALWLKFNLLAERDTRDLPRVFVEYANLLEDWRREVKRISVALGIDLENRDEDAIEEFLTPDLHRQRRTGPVTETFGTDWISAVYETLHAAARDEPWDQSELDRVYSAYRTGEQGFRAVFENSLRLNKLNRFIRPSILKLRYEVVAMAHRRRGTWA
ncbi:sulfotransferase family protein [Mycolicibacterium sp. HK-90]|uniref:sulfotransferase family protein n=1 Tax=Mycolicibacterium sp. HK-90 TaxID=3056937 RepID=UPI0026583EAD|nr:sulfotransferase family protein [Mycolicibacterium sp. HK-90]WKG06370.1 sulfotransferase family protein [Mycolicibacterium sp. HK-90]